MIDLLKECEGACRIGISGHVRPDGDCVGACLALRGYLRKAFPKTSVNVYLQAPADIFKEIAGFDDIITDFPKIEEPFDVYFCLDSDTGRISTAKEYFDNAKKKINIDHHVSNAGCGDINVMQPEIGSTCEVLFDLMDKDLLDKDIAMALYIGIIHDTGVFQYSCTTPETLRKAACLLEYGFDFPRIIKETFYQKTYVQAQIMGRALMESVRFLDGRCVVSKIDRDIMKFYSVVPADLEGIVNQLGNIKGVDCAVFMYQTETLEYKVSLRSNDAVDVAKVASYFGGGGHIRAAGCTMKGTFYDCVNNLSLHIEEQL